MMNKQEQQNYNIFMWSNPGVRAMARGSFEQEIERLEEELAKYKQALKSLDEAEKSGDFSKL